MALARIVTTVPKAQLEFNYATGYSRPWDADKIKRKYGHTVVFPGQDETWLIWSDSESAGSALTTFRRQPAPQPARCTSSTCAGNEKTEHPPADAASRTGTDNGRRGGSSGTGWWRARCVTVPRANDRAFPAAKNNWGHPHIYTWASQEGATPSYRWWLEDG